MCRRLLKIGKKFCYPDVPSSWVSRTVESMLHFQDYRPKHRILYPSQPPPLVYKTLPQYRGPCWVPEPDDNTNNNNNVKDGFTWYSRNCYQLVDQLFIADEKDEMFNLRPPFEKGQTLDVMSLLSTTTTTTTTNAAYLVRNDGHQVPVESLRGKDVLLCCFLVPQLWLSFLCDGIRHMINVFSNLPNLEVVLVLKMRRHWANDEHAFHHFFSGFPSSWLAIPFSDTLRRDKLFQSICLPGDPTGLLVDHHQTVVVHKTVDEDGLSFPPLCAPELNPQLLSNLDSEFVFKINNNNNNSATVGIDLENKVSVSVFKDKLVGLYLCRDGTLIRSLNLISQECKARDQEFHIILVYLPYGESVDPLLFQEAVNHALHKLEIFANPHWWVSPFNDFVSRKLWEAGDYGPDYEEDQLVILDPKMNIADPLGKYVINRLGIDGYPFTRHFLLHRELEAIRAVTLESLLVYGSRDYVLRMNVTNDNDIGNNIIDQVPIGELRGKNVLLYIDQVETPSNTYYTLLEWYNRNKAASVADFEVVFVHFDGQVSTSFGSPKPKPMPMPWLVCPFDPEHTVFVKERILKACTNKGILAAFDRDGHIITLFAKDLLDSFGPEGFPSYNGLHNEMVHHIERQYHLNMDDLFDHGPMRSSLFGSDGVNFSLFS